MKSHSEMEIIAMCMKLLAASLLMDLPKQPFHDFA